MRATGAVALDHAARTLANEPGNNPSQATDFRAAALADILRCFEGWRRYRDEHPVSYELLIPVLLGTDPDSVKRTAPLLRIVEAPLGHAARVGALRPDLSGRRALLFLSSLHGALLHEDPLLGRELLLALLCGWGAPRHLLETLSAPV